MSTSEASKSNKSEPAKKSKENYEFIKVIGEGSFSTVHLAKDKKSGSLFAIKECDKSQIMREQKVKYVHLEKKILAEYLTDHPFFVKLCCTFQDEASLYFCLSYCPNGDLLAYIKKLKQFPLDLAIFYSAEIVEALEYCHRKKVVHRDLKPENILLDENFHIKLTDFGTARILDEETNKDQTQVNNTSSNDEEVRPARARRNSFVGTAQFVAPECLQGNKPHFSSDLWALGCILFQMITGKHLFTGSHEYDIFQKIINLRFLFPDEFPELAQDLIKKLVVTEPENRLGANDYKQLKDHEFFKTIDWTTSLAEKTPPKINVI